MGEPGPFARHIREAIALNRTRAPLYAALSGGRSRPVSRRLVAMERLLLPAAWGIDRWSRPWRAAGVGIVRDDFVEMRRTPPAPEGKAPPVPLSSYARPDARRLARKLRGTWRSGRFEGVRDAATAEIGALEAAPAFHAMLRHLLESLRRAAHLAPRHDAEARAAGLGSTLPVSAALVRLHLRGFGAAVRLDHLAAPLQAEGVPILTRDLPHIPMEG